MIASILDLGGDLSKTLSFFSSENTIITTDKKLDGYITLPKEGSVCDMKNRAYDYYLSHLKNKGKFLDLLSGDVLNENGNETTYLVEGENKCEGWLYSKWENGEQVKIDRDLEKALLEVEKDPLESRRNLYKAHLLLLQEKPDLNLFLQSEKSDDLRDDEKDYARYRAIEILLRQEKIEEAENLSTSSKRREPLSSLCSHYRTTGKNSKAYEKYLQAKGIKEKGLFHRDVERSLEYDFTIFGFYIGKKEEALRVSIQELMLKNCINPRNILDNIEYYVKKLDGEIFSYKFPDHEDYTSSSCSLREDIMNIRYVNYRLDDKGNYTMKDGIVRTKNFYVRVGKDLTPITWPKEMKEGPRTVTNGHIKGVEDLRLYKNMNTLRFSSSCADIVSDKICITVGDYNIKDGMLTSFRPILTENRCEKNWLGLDGEKERFIYSWNPYRIIEIKGNKIVDVLNKPMPYLFHDIRGSASPVKYGEGYLCLVHSVKYGNPRKYFHWFVYMDKDYLPLSISTPFYFESIGVEYCMLIKHIKGKLCLVYSKQDRDTTRMIIKSPSIDSFIPIYP